MIKRQFILDGKYYEKRVFVGDKEKSWIRGKWCDCGFNEYFDGKLQAYFLTIRK